MRHGNIHQLRHKIPRRRLANEKPDLLKGVGDPGDEDDEGDADCADGVEVPGEAPGCYGHYETEEVYGDVVAMIDLRGC